MRLLLDTNVLVAAVTRDTDRSDAAVELLNEVDELYVSVLNLMELRSVLAKKKGFDRDRIETIERRITARTTVTFPDASDVMAANTLSRSSFSTRWTRSSSPPPAPSTRNWSLSTPN
jgi:predicted nucleic acid-binding protein